MTPIMEKHMNEAVPDDPKPLDYLITNPGDEEVIYRFETGHLPDTDEKVVLAYGGASEGHPVALSEIHGKVIEVAIDKSDERSPLSIGQFLRGSLEKVREEGLIPSDEPEAEVHFEAGNSQREQRIINMLENSSDISISGVIFEGAHIEDRTAARDEERLLAA
jgi:hypothetical protein